MEFIKTIGKALTSAPVNDPATAFDYKPGESKARRLEQLYYAILVCYELDARVHSRTNDYFMTKEEFSAAKHVFDIEGNVLDAKEVNKVMKIFSEVIFVEYLGTSGLKLTDAERTEFLSGDRNKMYEDAINGILKTYADSPNAPESLKRLKFDVKHIRHGTLGEHENNLQFSIPGVVKEMTASEMFAIKSREFKQTMMNKAMAESNKSVATAKVAGIVDALTDVDDDTFDALTAKLAKMKLEREMKKKSDEY